MKAVYITEFGSVDGVELREVEMPGEPAGSEVLVRVRAAGLNRADLLQAKGLYPPPSGFSPNIPGLEFAGEIVSCGDGVADWTVGDGVFGITGGEAQAEYLRIDHRLLMRIPPGLGFAKAAAIPEAFITAHDAVVVQGGLKAGETLLIHAVGSGVGLAALQLGKALGARVIGTSRTDTKLELGVDLGLDSAITVSNVDELASAVLSETDGRGVDLILDLVGAAYFQQNLGCLATKGRLLLVGLPSGAHAEMNLAAVLQKRATIIGTLLRGRSVEEKAATTRSFADDRLAGLASGKIEPNVDRIFPAKDAAEAYRYLASNKNFGKVVLDLSF